ncbi:pyridoxal phosphate-dependent aminotransferase [Aquabacterium sp. A7-Y]|uniref:pyridoxal phosphate-dependent aminotransferase n=1 Tax=Aquabacterium sp. A7-Y TaxID=1349605 RepID=UPI00223D1764|nr:pyridoxal phosphate-dependent aminotransferase [Aquabacterium sp. A7-Y]MCW7539166.1 pyridoxal phosphate-dependent aminotransferase [Aquabacterium sp. A7-Y]
MKFAERTGLIEPFYVMECAKAADELARSPACDPARGGRPMIYLNIGEPDFTAAPLVQEAAQRCVVDGLTQYTPALGLPELREAISGWYRSRFGVQVPARRIVVTAGASGALQLACLALVDAGDEVLMPDPSYPCNRHFVAAAQGRAVLLPSGPEQRFQLSAAAVQAAWGERSRGVLLASPSNPTGTSIHPDEMRRIAEFVRSRGGVTLVDEIYLGLSFDDTYGQTALALGEDIVTLNSFSKYFSMTGWRLGWMVVPEAMVPVVEKLAQNLYICASAVAQRAALACFEAESLAEFERRRAEFRRRRDYLVPALDGLGLRVPVLPDGAFYAWADCSAHHASSWEFVFDLMQRAQLAITPGRDFGSHGTERYIRLSYASRMGSLEEAVDRLKNVL